MRTCIVHLLRHSLDLVSWKDRKPVAAASSREIYRAVDADAGEAALTQRWRETSRSTIDGADGLELHHLYRAMAWLGEALLSASKKAPARLRRRLGSLAPVALCSAGTATQRTTGPICAK